MIIDKKKKKCNETVKIFQSNIYKLISALNNPKRADMLLNK